MNRKGFTLIELLVVISIIALLSSVVLASLNGARDKARIGAARQFASQVERLAGDSAVGIWDFDECGGSVAGDRSGFGNDGALMSMEAGDWTDDTPSGRGCALSFDGSNEYVIGDSPQIDSAFTMTGWYYLRSVNSSVPAAFGNFRHSPLMVGANFIPREGNVRVCTGDGGAYTGCSSQNSSLFYTPIAKSNQWIHAAVTYDGAAISVYLDGKHVGSGLKTIVHTDAQFLIGKWSPGSAGYNFDGMVDDVRVYAKTLTASEVGKLYASEAPRFDMAAK